MREDVIAYQLVRLLRELAERLEDHPRRKYRRLGKDMDALAERLEHIGDEED